VVKRVLTIGLSPTYLCILIATPSLTILFRAKLLIVIYTTRVKSGCLVISLLVIV
jgi:hypothetical protein